MMDIRPSYSVPASLEAPSCRNPGSQARGYCD
jgi:hypothetical protein